MRNPIEQPWIEAGYEIFSKEGPKGLKVLQIATRVGISKSSFYHLFADLEVFQEKLLAYHLERAAIIEQKARTCKSIIPETMMLLAEHKQDLLFNRQLRINRDIPGFQPCFEKANTMVEDVFFDEWARILGLTQQPHIARTLLKLSADNFYLRMTEETFTYEWILRFLEEIQVFVRGIRG